MNIAAKKLASAGRDLMPLEFLRTAAECLKCVAHPHRLRIIEILFRGKFSVDDIASMCELSQPATSGHLRLMEAKGLLRSERNGRVVYYSVAEPQLKGILDCVRGRCVTLENTAK
ncbi:MAG: winged helix-turn-helix transcriptional regulator [Gammaproteobacteria bacterium]|nr:winged helix-turn-helix transcriptional regulator [Gammaproteobacteria bacterium]